MAELGPERTTQISAGNVRFVRILWLISFISAVKVSHTHVRGQTTLYLPRLFSFLCQVLELYEEDMLISVPRIAWSAYRTGSRVAGRVQAQVHSPAVDLMWRSQSGEMIWASTVFSFSSLHSCLFLLLLASLTKAEPKSSPAHHT